MVDVVADPRRLPSDIPECRDSSRLTSGDNPRDAPLPLLNGDEKDGMDGARSVPARVALPVVMLVAAATLTFCGCGGSSRASGHVYWVNYGGALNEVSLGGGSVTTLATNASEVEVSGTHVYWDDSSMCGTVNSLSIGSSGKRTILARDKNQPDEIAVNGTQVYWLSANGDLNEVPIGGGSVTTFANGGVTAGGLAVDGTHAYWLDGMTGNMVNEVPVAGGGVTILVDDANSPQGAPASIAVAGRHVYWTETGFPDNRENGTVN